MTAWARGVIAVRGSGASDPWRHPDPLVTCPALASVQFGDHLVDLGDDLLQRVEMILLQLLHRRAVQDDGISDY